MCLRMGSTRTHETASSHISHGCLSFTPAGPVLTCCGCACNASRNCTSCAKKAPINSTSSTLPLPFLVPPLPFALPLLLPLLLPPTSEVDVVSTPSASVGGMAADSSSSGGKWHRRRWNHAAKFGLEMKRAYSSTRVLILPALQGLTGRRTVRQIPTLSVVMSATVLANFTYETSEALVLVHCACRQVRACNLAGWLAHTSSIDCA